MNGLKLGKDLSSSIQFDCTDMKTNRCLSDEQYRYMIIIFRYGSAPSG